MRRQALASDTLVPVIPFLIRLPLPALVQLFTVASSADTTASGVSSTVGRIQQYARPLGATMVAFGLTVLAFGL